MKIEYKKVTWYSKLLAAIIVFGVLPALAFYVGVMYQEVQEINPAISIQVIEKPIYINITKSQAEILAGPIIKKCWDNQSNGRLTTESFTTKLVTSIGAPFWNVGGNYIEKDFGVMYHNSYGNIPEVGVDAQTGEIIDRHFGEIGPSPGGKECN